MFSYSIFLHSRMFCIYWMFLLATFSCSECISTALYVTPFVFGWMVMLGPVMSFGEMYECWNLMHFYFELYHLQIWTWLLSFLNFWEYDCLSTILSEWPYRLYCYIHHLQSVLPCIRVHFSPAPGCCSPFRVAPIQVKQPEWIAPRCGVVWTRGSMMSSDFTEISAQVFCLLFWSDLNFFLLICMIFLWTLCCMLALSHGFLLTCFLGCLITPNFRGANICWLAQRMDGHSAYDLLDTSACKTERRKSVCMLFVAVARNLLMYHCLYGGQVYCFPCCYFFCL
uniref:Uncharacterized protein n=1 Tax=Opuntia streptacantha TaxID=393608 RepID=A0A7C9EK41_OPUST